MTEPTTINADLRQLAPKFAAALGESLNRAWRAGLDPIVYEAVRSDARQQWLYAQGRPEVPGYHPGGIVTNARDARHGWHFFGLAVDIISRKTAWDDPGFFTRLAPHLIGAGLDWGGDWSTPDRPHFQWGACKPTPSDQARTLYDAGGLAAVWRAVGAA